MISKKILTAMQNAGADDSAQLQLVEEREKQIRDVKKDNAHHEHMALPTKITDSTTEQSTMPTTTENRMVIILDGKTNSRASGKKENLTAQATKENVWPEFKESSTYPSQSKELPPPAKTLYPWQNRAPNKSAYQRNFGFAYHRVTGKPSAHLPSPDLNQRTHNAYIAVSVIAPKEHHYDRKDKLLENELRQLRPWNHNQNLKNMATIRSNWVIQNDDDVGENRVEGESKKRG